ILAQKLAEKSGISVMVRPLADSPIARWRRHAQSDEEGHSANVQGAAQGDSNHQSLGVHKRDLIEEDLDDDQEPQDIEQDIQDDDREEHIQGLNESIEESSGHQQSPESGIKISWGKALRLRGGAGALDSDPYKPWKSSLHEFKVHLDIHPAAGLVYNISLYMQLRFTVQSRYQSKENPDLQPQIVSWTNFRALPRETRSIETDRSYSNICFIVTGKEISDPRPLPCPGYLPPQQTRKTTGSTSKESGVSAKYVVPHSGEVTAYSKRGYTESIEHQNDRVTPKCWVNYSPGKRFDDCHVFSDSYNVVYETEDDFSKKALNAKYPMEVEFSMGICVGDTNPNTRDIPPTAFLIRNQTYLWVTNSSLKAGGLGILALTSAYVPDIQTEDGHSFTEKQSVDLTRNILRKTPPQNSDFKTSASILVVPRQTAQKTGKYKAYAQTMRKFLGFRPQEGPKTDLDLYEHMARGWDAGRREWKMPEWPILICNLQGSSTTNTTWDQN
ncbi:hypothetical protein GGX14DRAFT_476736, partial [Mycena pura]